ncbi:MAG: CRISPR-associated protein Cas4 [Clostridiales bacterium]|nr:CRISPR-associated protein Cas4 [Clostridiales bacterium]
MPSCSADRELFPLSWLAQYGYCPRRCGLLALDQAWVENEETAAGRFQHQRVHTARIERKGEDLLLYELSVFSRSLGVSGKCDCVEARAAPDGVALPYGEGRFQLYPVEYKHGVVRNGEEECHLQLCAQALCLEEQFGCSIPAGAIFYINSHRRDEVALTAALRQKTMETTRHIQAMLAQDALPPAKYSAKCKKCSMLSLCQPKWKRTAKGYCQTLWNLTTGEESP